MNQGKTYTVTNEDRFLPLGVLFIDDDVDVMAVKTPVYYLRDPQAGQVVRTAQDKKVSTDATLSEAGVTYTYVGDKQFRLKERVEVQDTDGNYLFTGVVVASAGGTTVTLKPVENVEHTAGDIVITNVKFDQMGAGNTEKAAAGLSFTENANATGAGNGFGKPSWLSDALNKAYNGEVIVN